MRKLVVLLFAVMIGFAAVPSTYAAPQGTIVARGPEVDKELQIGDFIQWIINMTVDDKEFIHEGERHILLFQDAIICKLKELDV